MLSGAHLPGNYVPEELVLHLGSDHTIQDRHFDIELHIIHRNMKYANRKIAENYDDGFVATTMMMDIVDVSI